MLIDEHKELILIDNKDLTTKITKITEDENTPDLIHICFKGTDKVYSYNKKNSDIVRRINPETIDPTSCRIHLRNMCLFDIVKILDFTSHIKIFYKSGKKATAYKKQDLQFEYNVLMKNDAKQAFTYLKELAKSIANEENDFLDKQYEKMKFLSEHSILAKYLNDESISKNSSPLVNLFPFGLNLSQETAVTRALSHQVSIIEGPPGTGKTQTILNIIANLLISNKTIAVVSNNNAAIQNVYDKLEAENLSFFAAMLGRKENIEAFFENQQSSYPQIYNISDNTTPHQNSLEAKIVHIQKMLHDYNILSKTRQELEAIKLEKKHFMHMYEQQSIKIHHEARFVKLQLEQILSFLAQLQLLAAQEKRIKFFFILKASIQYKIFLFSIYKYSIETIILFLQKCFYEIKERNLNVQIELLEKLLKNSNFEAMLDQYKNESMALLKLHLSKKYNLNQERQQFDRDILWKDFAIFSKEYPVILSTTHSLKKCTGENFLYDYLIIDEASQVDIVAGGLALSCARNVIIVGDQKQLSHISSQDVDTMTENVFKRYSLAPAYHYSNSLLASASIVYKGAPKTLLKEHYRCHPKIIDFCNKKFYSNQLIILSKENSAEKPLILINTAEGNHARGQYNQRQIDVIKHEVLPHLNTENVGIISPFRQQVKKLNDIIKLESGIEIDTVHKYQGREKDIIIITTVVDKENEFADDPKLLNVAISRAKKELYIVVSDRENNQNMKDLVNYIRYNNFDIIESKIYSIFDLLYQSYAPYLKKYLDKLQNISQYQSENLMNALIDEVLSLEQYSHLRHLSNYYLSHIVKDITILTEEELTFTRNKSHIDFLIYNQICNQPILAIEVDGINYHENNPIQLKRDALKDQILSKCNLPMIRFATNGSEEKQKLIDKLKEVM